MKARGGFTLVELLLAGAILATISVGALIGMIRLSNFVDKRGELMAADGFCWDLAWNLFNNYKGDFGIKSYVKGEVDPYLRPEGGNAYFEISGPVLHDNETDGHGFLNFLIDPYCYIILSNRYDSARADWADNGFYDPDGVYISVNLAWGPPGHRSILMRRADVDAEHVYDHPITLFCGEFSQRKPGQ